MQRAAGDSMMEMFCHRKWDARVVIPMPDKNGNHDFFQWESPRVGKDDPLPGKTAHTLTGAFHPIWNQHIFDFHLA